MSKNIPTDTKNLKTIANFEAFSDLMEEAKYGAKTIFYNGKKMDKRKSLTEDFEDIFDNNIPVQYIFEKGRLDIIV